MRPKFVSFQAVNVPNHAGTQTDVLVYALGDDGKIYVTDMFCQGEWTLMEPRNATPKT